jgi:hypothetical protein
MVLQIRTLRPDVIITNHDTTSGHGHHQATGRLILQAFDAAADPKQFPEQLNQSLFGKHNACLFGVAQRQRRKGRLSSSPLIQTKSIQFAGSLTLNKHSQLFKNTPHKGHGPKPSLPTVRESFDTISFARLNQHLRYRLMQKHPSTD